MPFNNYPNNQNSGGPVPYPNQMPQNSPYGYSPQIQYPTYSQPMMPTKQGLAGRMIDNESDISSNEVLYDGTPTFFPTKDGEKIIVKYWNQQEGLKTIIFSKQTDTQVQGSTDLSDILARIEKMEGILYKNRNKGGKNE